MTDIREIPLNKLKQHPKNARKTGANVGIESLAASIAVQGLLQLPVVEPEIAEGAETGFFLVTAGERRRKALLHLAKEKKLKKTTPIACLVRTDGDPAEFSLAENVMREAMHPADQFEAFAALHEGGSPIEDIAARFGVTPNVVRQRLKLASVSPKLMLKFRDGELTLEQMMAFAVTDSHAMQEEVWESLSWNRSPEMIRKSLTSHHVSPKDKRAIFIGAEAYEAAGGTILRDLFVDDGGGWFTDSQLLDRLVREKLEVMAGAVRNEGWKWVEVHIDHPLLPGYTRVHLQPDLPLSDEEEARLEAAHAQYAELEAVEYETVIPEEVAVEIEALDHEIDAFKQKKTGWLPEDVATSGVIVSVGPEGTLRLEKGLVKPEDLPKADPPTADPSANGEDKGNGHGPNGSRPLSDALLSDLTAHRTMALQASLASRPDVAMIAIAHALALRTFKSTCVDQHTAIGLKIEVPNLDAYASGIGESSAGEAMTKKGAEWAERLPKTREELWDWLIVQDVELVMSLIAYCIARTIDAVRMPNGRRGNLAHADQMAKILDLNMAAWWEPTGVRYLSRVSKARILEAVREATSEADAAALDGMKKEPMVLQAERLLAGKGWLPEVLR